MLKKYIVITICILTLIMSITVNATEVGEKLPFFSGKDMEGQYIDLQDIIGKNPVMLIFWSSWCNNCRRELPKINDLVKRYQEKGMKFIGINVGMNDSIKKARQYIKDYKITYPVVFDKTGALSEKFQVSKVLAVFVARKDGKVVMRYFNCPEIDDVNFKSLQQLAPGKEAMKK